MKKNLLNNYVLDLLESLEQNLSDYTSDKKPKHLHNLRVNLKKIKAIFFFIENINKEKHNAIKLKSLFVQAGKIREIYININLLSTVPHSPERLLTPLKEKENILTQQFIKNRLRYSKLINDFREKVCLPEMFQPKKAIIGFFKNERKKAKKILRQKDRESLHRYRKKIKQLMYIYNALPKKMQNKIEWNETEINKQQMKLGDWHDLYSAINYFSNKNSIKKPKNILKLKDKEKKRFKTLRRNLTEKVVK
ncbi:MAG: CHAD domain-containing protein [Saprospiraceae bacterium]|nr:CHAD domain-containing protein [Saprospiraceae bacterium]